MEHLRITVQGKVYDVMVEKVDSDEMDNAVPHTPPVRAAAATSVQAAPSAPAAPPPTSEGDALSPLAGIVKAIEVGPGTKVSEGDLIVTLEAMKMYTSINATTSGTVTRIYVRPGDAVEEGQPLYAIG